MSFPYSEFPGLLPNGVNSITVAQLEAICVTNFPLSKNRPQIFRGFFKIYKMFVNEGIKGDLLVNGSFITEEIEPKDLDSALCVSAEFYENSSPVQRGIMDWIKDEHSIGDKFLCDCYLCVEYPKGHPEYFVGIQNRLYWENLFRFSVVLKRERGIGVIHL